MGWAKMWARTPPDNHVYLVRLQLISPRSPGCSAWPRVVYTYFVFPTDDIITSSKSLDLFVQLFTLESHGREVSITLVI